MHAKIIIHGVEIELISAVASHKEVPVSPKTTDRHNPPPKSSKIPHPILNEVGYFDKIFICGAEDVDYRIRCAKKGFDVNFLLNSYLLHFHGKSTWDGGETNSEIEKRNKLYTEAFSKKWGKDMTQIFIQRKNFSYVLQKKELNIIFEQRRFRELIKELLK